MKSFPWRVAFAAACVLAQCAAMQGQEARRSKAEIVKRAKPAVAYVETKEGSGSAYCIHGSGIFITNEHVVRGHQGRELKLVLHSGEQNQKIVAARVLQEDPKSDLAALKADGLADWPVLPLGADDDLVELQDVFAIGFPFGVALAAKEKTYPEVSLNAGTITALRKKDGALNRLQLDVVLNPGNSGGPVLDEQGNAIGTVVSGITRASINYAIPVSHLRRFVEAPVIDFTPPAVGRGMLDQTIEFTALGLSLLPDAPQPTLTLLLKSDDEAEPRVFPMTPHEGTFVAAAAPFLRTPGEDVELSVRFPAGSVSGVAADAPFTAGERPLRLRDVKRIELGDKPHVVLADGKTKVEGQIQGLDAVEIRFGGEVARLNLARAKLVQVQAVPGLPKLTATIVAKVDGREAARLERVIRIGDGGVAPVADVDTVEIVPPMLEQAASVKMLPEPFADVAQGGGGRYLIFHLPRLHKLAVFDVNAADVTGYIPLAEDKVAFAAGLDAVVIGLPVKNALERWRLSTLTQELVALPDSDEAISTVIMGHASNGPVAVNGSFLDLNTLRPLPIKRAWDQTARPIASADGTLFGSAKNNQSPRVGIAFLLEGSEVVRVEAGETGHVVPGPDGSRNFLAAGVASRNLIHAAPEDAKLGWTLPAARGPLFASFDLGTRDMAVRLPGWQRPLAVVPKVLEGMSVNGWDRETFGAWRRVYFIPQANLVISLPDVNDRMVLHRIDIDAALENSGMNYLFVMSQAPRAAACDSLFSYQMSVKAKHAPVSYRLETGPVGMTISPEGVIKWQTPRRSDVPSYGVVVAVQDQTGREIEHSFAIRLER